MTTGERQGRNFISVLGALPPSPRNLSLWGQNVWTTMKTLERRIGLRRNATRAPTQAREWQGGFGRPNLLPRTMKNNWSPSRWINLAVEETETHQPRGDQLFNYRLRPSWIGCIAACDSYASETRRGVMKSGQCCFKRCFACICLPRGIAG